MSSLYKLPPTLDLQFEDEVSSDDSDAEDVDNIEISSLGRKNIKTQDPGDDNLLEETDEDSNQEVLDETNVNEEAPEVKEEFRLDYGSYEKIFISIRRTTFKMVEKVLEYECKTCDFRTANDANIDGHRCSQYKAKLFACSKCDFKATCKSDMAQHIEKHSRVPCIWCNTMFQSRTHLQQHNLLVHHVRYTCQACCQGRVFRQLR